MSAISLLAQKINFRLGEERAPSKGQTESSRMSDVFWFSVSFLLFLALGPFSAIATFFAILSMKPGDDAAEPMPET